MQGGQFRVSILGCHYRAPFWGKVIHVTDGDEQSGSGGRNDMAMFLHARQTEMNIPR
ncbi:hypothetical protein BC826DRAFT_1019218 [Russula brevipes]|nr:hypothetical protein BC826DRAFT_1019218 [Russula brevipes]